MPWFRLEDGFHSHPKVRQAGNAAVGLWVRCGTYCAHYLTDGNVPVDVAREYGKPREIEALVAATLWLPNMNGDGFVMPDYLDYNPSADEVREHRATDRAAKRKGGLNRAQSARRDVYGHFIADP